MHSIRIDNHINTELFCKPNQIDDCAALIPCDLTGVRRNGFMNPRRLLPCAPVPQAQFGWDGELPVDAMQVHLDGAFGQSHPPRDLLVGDTLREHPDDLALALGQRGMFINWQSPFSWRRLLQFF
jgi:hypothetical protein